MARAASPADTAIAADPLVVIRAEELAARTGLADPHAPWFITDAGRMLAGLARELDPMYVALNLARFRWFSRLMAEAADRFGQIVVLGAGYDTRPLWLPGVAGRRDVAVYEVDYERTLSGKAAVLKQHGVAIPPNLKLVPVDLNEPGLHASLKRAGFKPERPAAVFAEGLLFFLAPPSMTWLLEPKRMRLAPGSTIAFDYWSKRRVNSLNLAVMGGTGQPLFAALPYPDTPEPLAEKLRSFGYAHVEVRPLAAVADDFWPAERHVDRLGDWYAATAELPV